MEENQNYPFLHEYIFILSYTFGAEIIFNRVLRLFTEKLKGLRKSNHTIVYLICLQVTNYLIPIYAFTNFMS